MGTGTRVVLYAADAELADRAAAAAFERMRELERALSSWTEESELERLVARAGTGPVTISRDLHRNLALALRFAHESGGRLDPTIAPLVELWRECRTAGALPDEARLAAARALVGHERVRLGTDASGRPTAELTAGTRLDLGATAKGDACDEALRVLAELGLTSALVEIGGDLALGAPPPGRDGWTVGGVDPPRPLSRCGVAGSGPTQQFAVIDGVRYAHLVDPLTGLGSTTARTVVVVAPTAAEADARATIQSLGGPAPAP